MKVDILALGMLSALRKALGMISTQCKQALTLDTIPAEDSAVYAMMQRADTIGVFQIESRAQMSMLPRLKPKNYYDLVIQIAIVRPGPIQGDMVHPYLKRRALPPEQIPYPSAAIKKILQRTLGVPIFQEQVMQLSMVAAGFSADEADLLRRSMAAWRRRGGLDRFERKLLEGMCSRGYSEEFAKQVFRQIQGFGEYGFPESHSASFALLAYSSAWLKHYHPAIFTCALLNSQPMGFYAPAQLIQDAERHGVNVLPIDVTVSDHPCTAVDADQTLRLGLCMIKGLSEAAATRIVAARQQQAFQNIQDLATRAGLSRQSLQQLARADALHSLSGHRRRSYWEVSGVEKPLPLFQQPDFTEATPMLRQPHMIEEVLEDYASNGFSLKQHPLSLLRPQLNAQHIHCAQSLKTLPNHSLARIAGLVIGRQRPSTAAGVIFVTLEDETGCTNVIVWPGFVEAQKKVLL
ncbi:MAG: helix-hairpin-helix domain-containing protein, partial [Planctomycetaceae bacterium]|nr:helix-hairpin-helix domain-containing protein [Planctomycetaceae bacterium]